MSHELTSCDVMHLSKDVSLKILALGGTSGKAVFSTFFDVLCNWLQKKTSHKQVMKLSYLQIANTMIS